jgi:hypothetical protein
MRLSLLVVLILVVVVVVGVYGSFYAYSTVYIQPEDLKTFQADLANIDGTKISNDQIKTMENLANQIENSTPINDLSSAQIANYSKAMQPSNMIKTNFEKLNNNTKNNQATAMRYDLLLKGGIAKEIRTAYNTKLINLRQQMIETQNKTATDFAAGNNKAVAADLKQYTQTARQYNQLITNAKTSLEKIVNQLKK